MDSLTIRGGALPIIRRGGRYSNWIRTVRYVMSLPDGGGFEFARAGLPQPGPPALGRSARPYLDQFHLEN